MRRAIVTAMAAMFLQIHSAEIASGHERILDLGKAFGSDGKTYTFASLSRARPVVFFLIGSEDHGLGFHDIERLSRELLGKVRVVGVVAGNEEMRLVRRRHPRFLVLNRRENVQRMEANKNSWVCGLEMAMMSPQGVLENAWLGYDRQSLTELKTLLWRRFGIQAHINLAKYPSRIVQGQGVFIGLGPSGG